jgi:3-hydroxyisobutyrate dehydrogenase
MKARDAEPPRVGFIGIGLMGLPMTLRLLARGYSVDVSGREPGRVAQALERGAREAKSAAEATTESDVVLVCVGDTDAVEHVVFGPAGVAEGAAPGKVLVDHSTTDAERTRAMARRLELQTGMGWVDAPVSGGPPAAAEGALTIMAGGDEEDIAAIRPVMAALGKNFTHMGAVGAGQVTKMINQIIAGVTFATLAEALKMAENAGIDAARIPACLAGGYADGTMLQRIYPRMAARQFEPPAGLARQMLKDLDMVADLARATHTPIPMAAQAGTLYRMLVARGHGSADTCALLKLYDSPEA